MVYLYIPGHSGFGNQLFMYAKAYAVASGRQDQITIINLTTNDDNHPFLLDQLRLDKTVTRIIKIDHIKNRYFKSAVYRFWNCYRQHLRECDKIIETKHERRYQQNFDRMEKPNVYIEGYFESYKHFDQYKEDLQKQFLPVYPGNSYYIQRAKECNSVALHIRGGDFVTLNRAMDMEYYFEAIDKIKKLVSYPVFFLVTLEDAIKKRVAEYIGDELVVVEIEGSKKDFYEWELLCNCKHHILSNSTYSWWGAYLHGDLGKIVVPNLKRYTSAEKTVNSTEYFDFYKESWTLDKV